MLINCRSGKCFLLLTTGNQNIFYCRNTQEQSETQTQKYSSSFQHSFIYAFVYIWLKSIFYWLLLKDNNIVQLLSTYRSAFKSSKLQVHSVKVWSADKTEELKGCFLCTDWDIFFQDADINTATESITVYISFCVDSIISTKTIKKYLNNKSYITQEIRECLNRKKTAFKSGTLQVLGPHKKTWIWGWERLGCNTRNAQNGTFPGRTIRDCGTLSAVWQTWTQKENQWLPLMKLQKPVN